MVIIRTITFLAQSLLFFAPVLPISGLAFVDPRGMQLHVYPVLRDDQTEGSSTAFSAAGFAYLPGIILPRVCLSAPWWFFSVYFWLPRPPPPPKINTCSDTCFRLICWPWHPITHMCIKHESHQMRPPDQMASSNFYLCCSLATGFLTSRSILVHVEAPRGLDTRFESSDNCRSLGCLKSTWKR